MKATRKLNIAFWLVLAVILMVGAYCNWEDYNFLSFLFSLLIHGGFCALCAYLVDRHINRGKVYKTFDDLKWRPWTEDEHYAEEYLNSKQSEMQFRNGYGITILCGTPFYSNGIDTYQVMTMKNGEYQIVYPWNTSVFKNQTRDQVTNIMKHLQTLK